MNNEQKVLKTKKDISEYSFFKNEDGTINSVSLSSRAAKGSVADAKDNYSDTEKRKFKDFVNKYV
jgi:hypothetical protein